MGYLHDTKANKMRNDIDLFGALNDFMEFVKKIGLTLFVSFVAVVGGIASEVGKRKITVGYVVSALVLGMSVCMLIGILCKAFNVGYYLSLFFSGASGMFARDILKVIRGIGFKRFWGAVMSRDWKQIITLLTEKK